MEREETAFYTVVLFSFLIVAICTVSLITL
jgi:hypothetical protein